MYEELRYRNITYLLGIFLTCGILFGITNWGDFFDLLFDAIALACVVTCYMWLRKTVILVGLFFYFFSFNFELLFNPLLTNSGTMTYEPFAFFIRLEIVAFILILAGLADSYFNDRFLNYKSRLTLTPIVLFLIIGTALIQILIRTYG